MDLKSRPQSGLTFHVWIRTGGIPVINQQSRWRTCSCITRALSRRDNNTDRQYSSQWPRPLAALATEAPFLTRLVEDHKDLEGLTREESHPHSLSFPPGSSDVINARWVPCELSSVLVIANWRFFFSKVRRASHFQCQTYISRSRCHITRLTWRLIVLSNWYT